MSWQLVAAGVTLRDQMNSRFPKRGTAADGSIGDTAHAARKSDHNPDANGWVHALDVDHRFGAAGDDELLLTQLRACAREGRDGGRISYIVHDDRLAQDSTNWDWELNEGLEHHGHIHISFTHAAETDGTPFPLPIFTPHPEVMWDGVVPPLAALMVAAVTGVRSPAAYRLACRLHDLGFYPQPLTRGLQAYPRYAIADWQRHHGYEATGKYGPKGHAMIFGLPKPPA
jgi:hypothetical protein